MYGDLRIYVFIVVFNVGICIFPVHAASTCQDGLCWDCGHATDKLELVCPAGYKVTGEIKVGWRSINSVDSTCDTPPSVDCVDPATVPATTSVSDNCLWKNSTCIFAREFGMPSYCSDVYPKYMMFFDFKCIKGTDIFTICSNVKPPQPVVLGTNTSHISYIITPGFKIPYVDYIVKNDLLEHRAHCVIDITTNTSGYGIHIKTAYMDLHADDVLIIYYNLVDRKVREFDLVDLYIPHRTASVYLEVNMSPGREIHPPDLGFIIEYNSYVIEDTDESNSGSNDEVHTTTVTNSNPKSVINKDHSSSLNNENKQSKQGTTLRPRVMVFFLFLMVIIFSVVLLTAIFLMVKSSMNKSKPEPSLEEGTNDSLVSSDLQIHFKNAKKGDYKEYF